MKHSKLDEPDYAAFAWKRFRRLMIWMVGAAVVTAIGGLFLLHALIGTIPIHMAIATGLGLFFSVMMAALLMGLVFLSAGSGHDEAIEDLSRPNEWSDDA